MGLSIRQQFQGLLVSEKPGPVQVRRTLPVVPQVGYQNIAGRDLCTEGVVLGWAHADIISSHEGGTS